LSRLDRLIMRELLGPWLFGVAIFSALIFASVLLVRITDWVVKGVGFDVVVQLVWLLLPGILVKTFAMALLLASLLAFGRLSNDSEIVAMRAAGASLFRVMRPVFLFSLAVAAISFAINEAVVPGASFRAANLQNEIREDLSTTKEAKPVHFVVHEDDRAVAFIGAMDFDLSAQSLMKVHILGFDKEGRPTYLMLANELEYRGPKDWEVVGESRVFEIESGSVAVFEEGVWPSKVVRPQVTPRNLFAGIASDLDAFSITQIAEEIRTMERDPNRDERQLNNLKFGFYNKIALPLSVVVFALLGAPLGIRSHRAGVATGFALSVALSFGYLMIVNFMAVYSKAGHIPAYVASFTPVALGIVAAAITIFRKNA
jgi:lipopolysaccharide export system permease protein